MSETSPEFDNKIPTLEPPLFRGTPEERGADVVAAFADRTAPVLADVERTQRLLTEPRLRDWTSRSIDIVAEAFPDDLRYIESTAAALRVDSQALFLAQHRALFPVSLAPSSPLDVESIADEPEEDGCSVGASRLPDGSGWVVKNRDNTPGRHIVTRHLDPAWKGDSVVAMSNIGGQMAASGGINTRGFCIVSTATKVSDPPPGIYRTILMSGLLARCATVDEAIEIIVGLPHLGGTVTMADASGAVANVELEPDAIVIEKAGSRRWVARTNHAVARAVAPEYESPRPDYKDESTRRLATMQRIMRGVADLDQTWSTIEPWVVEQMGRHDGTGPVCRHGSQSPTIATTVFLCNPPTMLTSDGPGCEGRWQRWTLTAAEIEEAAVPA